MIFYKRSMLNLRLLAVEIEPETTSACRCCKRVLLPGDRAFKVAEPDIVGGDLCSVKCAESAAALAQSQGFTRTCLIT